MRAGAVRVKHLKDKNMAAQKLELLRRCFGYSEFRSGQDELTDALLSGRDVLGVMPTGAGKSICYQLPALLMRGITLVVSPLISLMKDQVSALTQSGVAAAYINSSLTFAQYREVLRRAQSGAYKIIYVAPERLGTADFLDFAEHADISMLAVDEAHCISQWGQDFRPSYLKIADFIASRARRPVIGAFTATATDEVKADIERLLQLRDPLRLTTGFDRPNLYFEVARPKNKQSCLEAFIARHPQQSGIVYCATRKAVEKVCADLLDHGISATRYHAGLEDEERQENQDAFIYDRARVMVATNAFGMGIDKSNVGFVVHYNMPKSIENYYQEAGRAGRDGEKAECLLLFSRGDVQTARLLITNSSGNEALSELEREQVTGRELQRLDKMVEYCTTSGCLRAALLGYFGESAPERCGNCGNCNSERTERDITVEAQKILSAVARVDSKYPYGLGTTLIMKLLLGSSERRVIQLGLDTLPTYGALRGTNQAQLREWIDLLITEGCLQSTGGERPVLHLTPEAGEVLFHGKKVIYTAIKPRSAERSAAPAAADEGLFGALKALRMSIAREENVPAYIIFTNAALTDMAAKRPRSFSELLKVSGVGQVKAKRYGKAFLDEIARYMAEERA